jgi:arylsulfatase A-like enzyme
MANGNGALAIVMALGLCGLGCRGEPPQPPSFILVSLDTTRADHLGVYGYERDTTPFLDELAERAVVFEQAIAPSSNTLVSHASLVTGLLPVAHGATPWEGGRAIDPALTTIAEDLAAHGYRTAAFLAHADWLSARFGFDQGFQRFVSEYRSAKRVLGRGKRWLFRQPAESPFFLFLHLYDVHSDWGDRPYDAPMPFRGKFAKADFDVKGMPASNYLGEINRGRIEITPAEVAVLRDQYDEGLANVDHQLRLFFDSLPDDLLARTWVFVVADHGEGFWEHGRLLHTTLHDEMVRIPMLMVPPADGDGSPQMPRPPVRVAEQVRLVDVRPTLLSLAGLPPPTYVDGVDLTPCVRVGDDGCGSRPATLGNRVGSSGLRFQGFKLLRTGDLTQLYDLEKDPGEEKDLTNHPEMQQRVRDLETRLSELVAAQGSMRQEILLAAESSPSRDMEAMDPEAVERLEALGYVQ